MRVSGIGSLLLLATGLTSASAQSRAKLNRYGNPEKLAPTPTTGAITEQDLQTRLYQFADDSMLGRQVGRIGNFKGTNYIAAELKRLGIVPAGDNESYFQNLPYHFHQFTNHSRLTVDGNPLTWETDWIAIPGARAPRPIVNVPVVYGGVEGDTAHQIGAMRAAGNFVVLAAAPPAGRAAGRGRGGAPAAAGRGGFAPAPSRFADAVAVATVDLDALNEGARAVLAAPAVATLSATGGRGGGRGRGNAAAPPPDSVTLLRQQIAQLAPPATLRLTKAAAQKMFGGRKFEALTPGTAGGTVTAALDYVELASDWGRNVVGIIPGSDPKLRHEYVAIGAHNDHVGVATPVDHDSLKAFNDARIAMLIANNMTALTPEQLSTIKVDMDSIRREHPRVRRDSVNNGADDDGSGSMALLEIAEAVKNMKVKPKRSVLFVWHTGEEAGLQGSRYFTDNPTVPMDSIVAQINIDMIGRGRAEDLPGGGPDYLGVVGSFFDSKDLGEAVTAVNKKQQKPLELDYKYDTTLTWSGYNNIYGRSDHYNYALHGVPIAFFFTGLHGDYHQRTDEPEFIDYPHYARIANYIRDLMVDVANGPRPRMNGTKPAKPPKVVP
ncbi:MAG TPA: M20/M25/M40 family metallo-hydrolase [Gemmatimonadaceae bacterium]|nr:M20/M25/M40 family metallo-hydrolase [Gemmatimonadaceae bacterium]